jgi:uncharacterized membrane protein YqiK
MNWQKKNLEMQACNSARFYLLIARKNQRIGAMPFIIGLVLLVVAVVLFVLLPTLLGLVVIRQDQVGIVIKRFDLRGRSLVPGQLLALKGEAGYQADTLAPGWHLGYWYWQYTVKAVSVTVIPSGQIGLVVAADGMPIPSERILAKVVDCDKFQDARKFIMKGGEKGRQLGLLTAGTYRINTALFTVITAETAKEYSLDPRQLMVSAVRPDMVGIVTTMDGAPIEEGAIAGLYFNGHDNFQNAQAFIQMGGRRGLQEQVLLSGSWNLNPWFVFVEQVPMTEIPIGYVGVVISYIGKAHEDISGVDFKHGDLVHVGHKGVWVAPLHPGKHPINTRVMRVELVPTTNIVLNWAHRNESHQYDNNLSSIRVRSRDGFAFSLDVSEIIHIGMNEAPKVISRVGSVQNLVDHVLEPTIGNYFRNSTQAYTVLDFLTARGERQKEASEHISRALRSYDVEAIDTLIGDINPPAELMATLTDRKIAEEQRKTYQVQQAAQEQRQLLVRETAQAEIQTEMVRSEKSVQIAELNAQAEVKRARGAAESERMKANVEAEAIRMRGEAQAKAYHAGVLAIGSQGYTAVQLMQIIGESHVRIIPDIQVAGGANGNNGIVDALVGLMLREQFSSVATVNGNGNGHLQPAEVES